MTNRFNLLLPPMELPQSTLNTLGAMVFRYYTTLNTRTHTHTHTRYSPNVFLFVKKKKVLRLANEIVEDAKPVVAIKAKKENSKTSEKKDEAAAVEHEEPAEQLSATPLQWNVSSTIKRAIEAATKRYNDEAARLQVQALKIDGFGKQFFKDKKVAPDGTVQQAIQLAYRRAFPLTSRAVATYESASTAAFKKGRTETIRPATIESSGMLSYILLTVR
jgi:hypothetical protein